MGHLDDDLGEMFSQIIEDLEKVSSALLIDDHEEQKASSNRASVPRIAGTHRMTGGLLDVTQTLACISATYPIFLSSRHPDLNQS